MNESEFNSAIGSLPRKIKPQRDLWPEINSRLEPREVSTEPRALSRSWRMPAMAAAVLLALTSGIFIGRGLESPSPEQLSILEYALAGSIQNTEREYQAAFQELV